MSCPKLATCVLALSFVASTFFGGGSGIARDMKAIADRTYMNAKALGELCNGSSPDTVPIPKIRTSEGRKAFCQGYISGVGDVWDRKTAVGDWLYCLPKGVSPDELASAFTTSLRRDSYRLSRTSISVIAHGFSEAYPCTSDAKGSPSIGTISLSELHSSCDNTADEAIFSVCWGYMIGVADALYKSPSGALVSSCYVDWRKSYEGIDRAWRLALTVMDLMTDAREGEPAVGVVASALHSSMPCP